MARGRCKFRPGARVPRMHGVDCGRQGVAAEAPRSSNHPPITGQRRFCSMRHLHPNESRRAFADIHSVTHFHGFRSRRGIVAGDVTGTGERRAERADGQHRPRTRGTVGGLDFDGHIIVCRLALDENAQPFAFSPSGVATPIAAGVRHPGVRFSW